MSLLFLMALALAPPFTPQNPGGQASAPLCQTRSSRKCRLCGKRFPRKIRDVYGKHIDVARWQKRKTVVVVVLKAPWCPVCVRQLSRLARIQARLRRCGLRFMVLSPGPKKRFVQVARRSKLKGLYLLDAKGALSKKLGLWHPSQTLYPGVFAFDAKRSIVWEDLGRNGAYYNDAALLRRWKCRGYVWRSTGPLKSLRPS